MSFPAISRWFSMIHMNIICAMSFPCNLLFTTCSPAHSSSSPSKKNWKWDHRQWNSLFMMAFVSSFNLTVVFAFKRGPQRWTICGWMILFFVEMMMRFRYIDAEEDDSRPLSCVNNWAILVDLNLLFFMRNFLTAQEKKKMKMMNEKKTLLHWFT